MSEQPVPAPQPFCGQCGEPGVHADCVSRAQLEPPRFCADCRRRMVVQVTPRGWTARCSEHGLQSSRN